MKTALLAALGAGMLLIVATSPLWGWWFLACAMVGRDPWHPTRAELR